MKCIRNREVLSTGTYIEVGKDPDGPPILAYRVVETISTTHTLHQEPEGLDLQSKVETEVKTGLTRPELYEEYFKGLKNEIDPPQRMRGDYHSRYVAVGPGYREALRRDGFYQPDGGMTSIKPFQVEDPYTARQEGASFEVLEVDAPDVYTLKGDPVPVGMYFDYIESYMSNEHYRLKKAVDVLMQRTDVTLLEGAGLWPKITRHEHHVYKRYIAQIPHYNQSKKSTKCISFIWHPSDEDFAAVCAARASGDLRRHRRLQDYALKLDLLGLGPMKVDPFS